MATQINTLMIMAKIFCRRGISLSPPQDFHLATGPVNSEEDFEPRKGENGKTGKRENGKTRRHEDKMNLLARDPSLHRTLKRKDFLELA
jgi:hypothetical protein